jgi:hypothetical protein
VQGRDRDEFADSPPALEWECVLSEHGIAQVKAMQVLSREQMAVLAGPKSAEAAHDEHEE